MPDYSLSDHMARNWWMLLVRGLLSIAFAMLAFFYPGLTLLVLILIFGAYALFDGVLALWGGIRWRAWWLGLFGALGVAAGVLAFLWPNLTAVALVLLIGAWAMIRGILEIVFAIQLRRIIDNEWMLILGGVLSMLFGLILFFFPAAGALALIWVIAAYALVFGMLLIGLSLRMRSLSSRRGVDPAAAGI